MSVSQPKGQLSIQSRPASLQVQSTPGQLNIDSTAARASMKFYSMLGLLGELVAYSGRQFERGLGDRVAAGSQLQAIEGGGNAVASLARERMFVDMNDRQFSVALMPSTPPVVSYSPGSVNISASSSPPQVQFQAQRPMIDIQAQKAEINVSRPQLRMSQDGVGLNIVA
jgi:hypothetical protein